MGDCSQCGASTGLPSCTDLFERLLALDHSRHRPWGPLHGVAVSCFFLQHPDHQLAPVAGNDVSWAILHAYLDGGNPALDALTARILRHAGDRERHGQVDLSAQTLPDGPRPTGFAVTIAHVAVDGTFPARGYEDRVHTWCVNTVDTWEATR